MRLICNILRGVVAHPDKCKTHLVTTHMHSSGLCPDRGVDGSFVGGAPLLIRPSVGGVPEVRPTRRPVYVLGGRPSDDPRFRYNVLMSNYAI